jgi:predicted nucleic acid-binding protein
VVPIDQQVCDLFGKERGRLRASKQLIGDFDLLVGATALRHNLTLLTNNRRHFEMIDGLTLVSQQQS